MEEAKATPTTTDPARSATDQRIRLLLFTNNRGVGGMEEHIDLIARRLDRSKFEVFAICPDLEEIRPFRNKLEQHSDHFAAITGDRDHPGDMLRLYQQVRNWRIQVAHMHNGYFLGHTLPYAVLRLAGVRKIYVTEHTPPDKREPFKRTLVRNAMTLTLDGMVCISEKHRALRSQVFYTPKKRTHVIENGIELEDFNPIPTSQLDSLRQKHNIPDGAQIIGSLVRLEPDKGIPYLLDAMPQILAACPKTHLILVGEGSLRNELEAQAARLNISAVVHFAGFHKEPQPYLGLMDVFVLPVPFGSMSIALLEAMAMRRAVVMTFGGKGEAVIHEQTGLCAEPRNPQSIAQNVIRVLQSSSMRDSLGAAARQHIEKHFSAALTAQRLGQLYASS
jgi:glycosyltransferase involved in cell wall biosynthesis